MSETDLATTDTAKAEVLNHVFALVFTGKCSGHATPFTESKGRDCENRELLTAGDHVQDHLKNVNAHKSVGPNEMCIGSA